MFCIQFQIIVTVDNGLATATFREVFRVDYEQATPVFDRPVYEVQLMENVTVNTVAFTANATSARLLGEIRYHVVGMSTLYKFKKNLRFRIVRPFL